MIFCKPTPNQETFWENGVQTECIWTATVFLVLGTGVTVMCIKRQNRPWKEQLPRQLVFACAPALWYWNFTSTFQNWVYISPPAQNGNTDSQRCPLLAHGVLRASEVEYMTASRLGSDLVDEAPSPRPAGPYGYELVGDFAVPDQRDAVESS